MSRKTVAQKQLTAITHTELVTWAVLLLGGDRKAIDTEDVAVKAFELAPKRFGWRKYPNQINLELVRVYLSDAKKPGKGELLSGSGSVGWTLTSKGLAWFRSARHRLLEFRTDLYDRNSKTHSVDASRRARELKRIQAMPAWVRWIHGDHVVDVGEARQLFRIDSYATPKVKEAKMTRLRAMFDDDDSVSAFLSGLCEAIEVQGD